MHRRELDSAHSAVVKVQIHDLSDTLTAINLTYDLIRIGRPTKESRAKEEQYRDKLCAMLEKNAQSLLDIAKRRACGE
jgi:cell division protein ZapA (FtsZ GTPase activity inhibitor)